MPLSNVQLFLVRGKEKARRREVQLVDTQRREIVSYMFGTTHTYMYVYGAPSLNLLPDKKTKRDGIENIHKSGKTTINEL